MAVDSFRSVADVPELRADSAAPRSLITLFRVGKFSHPRWGAFTLRPR